MIRKVVKILWIFIALISLVCVFIFFSIAKGWIGYMPPVEDLENPNYKFATEVFSEDGKVLGTYSYSKENRVFVGYNDLSPNIINALIATEDVRFAEHSGIDAYALTRAVVKRGILMQKNAGGGSTITQQLSKQLYSPSADNVMERLFQKPIEWVIAVKLERYYTKEEILTMYLNKFDFPNNAVGIKTAAFTYFGCEPKDLKIEEAATLVGMCKNPSLYNPVRYNERSRGRRNGGARPDAESGIYYGSRARLLQALPLKLKYNRVDHKEGLATYFRRIPARRAHRQEARQGQLPRLADAEILRGFTRLGEQPALWMVRKEHQERRYQIQPLHRRAENLYHARLAYAAVCRGCRDKASEGTARLLLQGKRKGPRKPLHLPSDPGAGGRDSGTCHEVVRPLPHYEESRSHRS